MVQRPNLDLVTAGIKEVVVERVRTRNGELHPCDVLVLGNGFQAAEQVAPFPIVGPAGKTLNESGGKGLKPTSARP